MDANGYMLKDDMRLEICGLRYAKLKTDQRSNIVYQISHIKKSGLRPKIPPYLKNQNFNVCLDIAFRLEWICTLGKGKLRNV